jgi:hypothetical protein
MKTSLFLTFVGGAIAGAAIALLFAPAKGEETRRRIKEFAEDQADKLGKRVCGPDCDCGCQEGEECTCDPADAQ